MVIALIYSYLWKLQRPNIDIFGLCNVKYYSINRTYLYYLLVFSNITINVNNC